MGVHKCQQAPSQPNSRVQRSSALCCCEPVLCQQSQRFPKRVAEVAESLRTVLRGLPAVNACCGPPSP
eukprot:7950188-Lingulodinium_polyedra.AAC.1